MATTGNPILDNPQLKAAFTAQMMAQQPAPQTAMMPPPGLPQAPSLTMAQPQVKEAPQPRGTLAGDQAELQREEARRAPLESAFSAITKSRFGSEHPLAGKVLGTLAQIPATAADIGLSGVLPRIGALTPGTSLNRGLKIHGLEGQIAGEEANAEKEATAGNIEAETANRNEATREMPEREADLHAEAEAKENPPQEWSTLHTPTGQLITAPNGNIVQQDKQGNVRLQPLPGGATLTPKANSGAFAEWSADPQKYESFEKAMADIKAQVAAEHPQQAKNAGFMNIYAAQRFMDMAYRYNPALLPAASSMIGKLLNLSPDQMQSFGETPAGQPENSAGIPIGTQQPESPTGATRSRGQFAESVLPSITDAESQIKNLGEKLGPMAGRYNDLYTGKVGAYGPEFSGLQTTLKNIGTAWMRLHANSETARREFEAQLSAAQDPANLIASLNAIDKQARDYVKEGKGRPGAARPVPQVGEIVDGYKFKGGDPNKQANWEEVKK